MKLRLLSCALALTMASQLLHAEGEAKLMSATATGGATQGQKPAPAGATAGPRGLQKPKQGLEGEMNILPGNIRSN